jgi:hypothetical protein
MTKGRLHKYFNFWHSTLGDANICNVLWFWFISIPLTITLTTRYDTHSVFYRLNCGMWGSNPTGGMGIYVFFDVWFVLYSFFLVSYGGVRLSPLGTLVNNWPILPALDYRWVWSSRWNEDWQGKPKHSEKTCPSATLSTTNLTWPDPGSNPGLPCGKSTTNRLSYSTALFYIGRGCVTDWSPVQGVSPSVCKQETEFIVSPLTSFLHT